MSENTVNAALRKMGFARDEMSAHGFRTMARTLPVERLPNIPVEATEVQLVHVKSTLPGSAYDRSEFLQVRVVTRQTWADFLDRLFW